MMTSSRDDVIILVIFLKSADVIRLSTNMEIFLSNCVKNVSYYMCTNFYGPITSLCLYIAIWIFWWRHQNDIYEKNADVSKILNFLWVKSFKHINTCFRTNFHIEMMFIKCFMDVLNISHYLMMSHTLQWRHSENSDVIKFIFSVPGVFYTII